MEKKKYLIDASIIASSLEDFKRRFVETDCTLVLSDLSFRELESKKIAVKDIKSRIFARFLIDLFVRDLINTKICFVEETNCENKHIDETLVLYAKSQNMSIITSDKGMALWGRFYNVECELLEVRSNITLPFIHQNNDSDGNLRLHLKEVPVGYSTLICAQNKIMSSYGNDIMFLFPGNILLVAQAEQRLCCIQNFYVNKDLSLSLISKHLYSSVEDIDTETNPFHFNLYDKWSKHMAKFSNFNTN